MYLIRLLAIISILLFGSSAYAEEKKLKFRGAAATDSSPTNVVINIHPEMLVLDEFKKINKNYNSLKAYAKKIDKLTKSREKINFLETKAKLNLVRHSLTIGVPLKRKETINN